MATFNIKEVVRVSMAYIYEVEAETKEEAVEKYINELSGSLEQKDCFLTPETEESITAYK